MARCFSTNYFTNSTKRMWTCLLCLLVIGSVSFQVLHAQSLASGAFDELDFPCASSCGSGPCFPTAWDEAAAQSKMLTAGCTFVVYSVAVDDRADSFNHIDDHWNSMTCSVLFLSANSLYLQRNNNASKVGNWNIVPVHKLTGSGFSDGRKASRVPKLSPRKFFAESAEFALYVDAKLELRQNPADLLRTHLDRSKGVALGVIGTYPYIRDLTHEIALIEKARAGRPSVTHNFSMVLHQGEVYASLNITGAGLAIDGAFIMHDLRSAAATEFTCMWFKQQLRFSDRDQVAFQGALWFFSHGNNDTVVDANGFRDVALDIAGGRYYLRMLPQRYWWNKGGPIAYLKRRSWNGR